MLGELNPDILLDFGEPTVTGGAQPLVAFGQVETEMAAGDLSLGSSGAITAVAAHTFGLTVAFSAVVGQDTLGALTLDLLGRTGVDTGAVRSRPDVHTGLTVVVNAPGGDRALLTYPGAMTALRVADVPSVLLESARHVHVSSLYLQRALQPDLPALFGRLRERGVSTSVDTGWDPAQRWSVLGDLLPCVDYLFPNEAELGALNDALNLGADRSAETWVTQAAWALHRRGPSVAVKQGGRGGVLCTQEMQYALTTTPQVPVDTTGAGDNFNAGFLHALLTGAPPPRCLASAVAAGTLSIHGRGGTGSIGTPEQMRDLTAELEPTVRTARSERFPHRGRSSPTDQERP